MVSAGTSRPNPTDGISGRSVSSPQTVCLLRTGQTFLQPSPESPARLQLFAAIFSALCLSNYLLFSPLCHFAECELEPELQPGMMLVLLLSLLNPFSSVSRPFGNVFSCHLRRSGKPNSLLPQSCCFLCSLPFAACCLLFAACCSN